MIAIRILDMAFQGLEPHSSTVHACRLPERLQQGKGFPRSRPRLNAKRVADSGYFADADPKGARTA